MLVCRCATAVGGKEVCVRGGGGVQHVCINQRGYYSKVNVCVLMCSEAKRNQSIWSAYADELLTE